MALARNSDPPDQLVPENQSPEHRRRIARMVEELRQIAKNHKISLKILPDGHGATAESHATELREALAEAFDLKEILGGELPSKERREVLVEKWKDLLPTEAAEIPKGMDLDRVRMFCAVLLENQAAVRERIDRDLTSAMLSERLCRGDESDEEWRRRIAQALKEKIMSKTNYVVVEDDFLQKEPLVIRDVGPWDRHLTVTNGAEEVVEELVAQGRLPEGRRLMYYDSEGRLDELLVKDGKFAGFAPGPGGRHP